MRHISGSRQRASVWAVHVWPTLFTRSSNHEQGYLPLKLPASIKAAAARLAKEDGVSLNQWIATAVAQKIGVVETVATLFRRRAGSTTPDDLKRVLDKVPDVPPDPEDAMPPDLADRLSRLR